MAEQIPTYSYMGGAYMGAPNAGVSEGFDPRVSGTPLAVIDNRSEFSKGLSRGTDSLQAMGLGALGLGADIVGAEGAKQYFYDKALEQQKEALNAPAAVEAFSEIESAGDLGKWFMGAVGEALPSSAASFMLSGAGAIAFRTVAGKLATDLATKTAVTNMAESLVAKGVAKEVAQKEAVKAVMREELVKQTSRGAYAGAMTSGTALESGSNWIDDVQKYGLEGTNPYKDLLFGAGAGVLEAGLGAERRLVGKLAAGKAKEEMLEASKRGLLKSIGTEIPKSSFSEGREEFGQQILSQAATMRDADLADMLYAKQDWKQNFNAGMAGAAGGVLFGAAGGTTDFLKSRGYKDTVEQNPVKVLHEEKQGVLDVIKKNAVIETQQYDAALQKVAGEKSRLLNNIYQINLGSQDSPGAIAIDAPRREQLIAQVEQQFMDLSAQEVKLKAAKEEYLAAAKSDYSSTEKKYDKKLAEAIAKEQNEVPKTVAEMQLKLLAKEREATGSAAVDQHAQREIEKASSRVEQHQAAIDTIHKQIELAKNTGGIIGNEVNKLLKFHEQQLADERKFLAAVSNNYAKAAEGNMLAAQALFTYYRDKNHANNLMSSVYQDTAKGVSDSVANSELELYRQAAEGGKPLSPVERIETALRANRDKSAAGHSIDSMTKAISSATRLAQIQETLKNKSVGEMQRWFNNAAADDIAMSQRVRDIDADIDLAVGRMPAPLPYGERSVSLAQDPSRAPMSATELGLANASRPIASTNMAAEMNRLALLRNAQQQEQPTTMLRPNQPNAYLQRVSQRKAEVREAEAQGAIAAWNRADELFQQHLTEMKQDEKRANTAFLKLSANTNAARNAEAVKRATTWISGTVSKLPALQDVVKVLHSDELYTLPDYVRDEYAGGAGLIDLKTGTIYMFADKFNNKQHAVRTLLHESVAHFGLRSIMTPEQLDKFLHMAARDLIGTDSWKDLQELYPDYDTFSIAEEYVAKYAEQIRLNPETMSKAKLAFEKVKAFLRNLLQELGLVKVTDQDIRDVLLASVYNLTKKQDLKDQVISHGDFRSVRESRQYKDWIAGTGNWIKDFVKKSNMTVVDGKVKPGETLTGREKILMALHDTENPILNLQYFLEQAGGNIDLKSNVYEALKTMPNEIANQVLDFLRNDYGVDPQNRAHRPGAGTVFDTITQLMDGEVVPKDPTKALEIAGLVLQAMHAREANRALALKSINTVQLARAEKKIAELEAQKNSGKKFTVKQITEIEDSLAKAKDLKERTLDVKEDLFGMSNEEADKIKTKYMDRHPNKALWLKLVEQVQEINKKKLDLAVAEGLLSPELRRVYDETYAFYVPNKRWEEKMSQISPSYHNMNKITNLGLWEYSKERTGTDELGANPIVAIARQYEDVIRVAAEKRALTALSNLAEAHPEQLSLILEKDNRNEINEYSNEIKKLQSRIDELMSDEDVKDIRSSIKALRKKIKELKFDQVKARNKLLKNVTDVSRAKADAALTQIQADLQAAEDNLQMLRQKVKDMQTDPRVQSIRQQQKDLRAERQKLYDQRGFTKYIDENGTIKWKRKPSKFTGQMDKVITVYNEEGKKVRYLVKDQHILNALKGTHVFKAEAVIKLLGTVQRIMAQLYTTFSPMFIPVNAFRDWLTANIHIRHLAEDIGDMKLTRDELTKQYNSSLPESLKYMWQYHRGEAISDPAWEQKVKDFTKYGGYTSMYNLGNFGKTAKILEHTLRRGISSKGTSKEALYATMNFMQDASGSIENASRLAAFSVIQEALMNNGYTREDASKVAAGAALDLTVNFTKKGSWGPIISSLFLFAQASINSSVRITRAMFPASDKNKPVMQRRITKYVAGLAMLGFMMAMLGRAIGGDDKDGVAYYDKLSSHKKYSNFTLPVGPNTFVTPPIAFGYQTFYTLGAIMADMLFGKIKPLEATASMFDSVMNNFSIVGGGDEGILALAPTAFKPLFQVAANKNYFGGSVYPDNKSWEKGTKPDSQKAWKNTNGMFKLFAETLNTITGGSKDRPSPLGITDISPASLEHVFRQYAGGLGEVILRTAGILEKTVKGEASDIELSDVPIISRFATKSTKENTMQQYSKIKKEIETQLAEYKRATEERVPAGDLAKVMNATSKGRLLDKRLDDIQNQLAALHKEENRIMANPQMSSERKFEYRVQSEKKAEDIMKRFIKSAHMMGVK